MKLCIVMERKIADQAISRTRVIVPIMIIILMVMEVMEVSPFFKLVKPVICDNPVLRPHVIDGQNDSILTVIHR